jgi:glycosyltransferase involved in cell wall biosynthesis
MTVALDATYSLGEGLSGVGLYSREILDGLAGAHPEVAFEWWYRGKQYGRSRAAALPPNARRRLLAEPLWAPRGADLFHGLNQRLPKVRMRCAIATFHDLFVMTGEYSTPEFRARFAAQAREAAERADAIIAVSEFTRQQVVELLRYPAERVFVVHHGTRKLAFPEVPREKVVLSVGAIQTRKNTARLVEAFETLDGHWRLVLAGSFGYGAEGIARRIEASAARERISVLGYVTPEELAGWYRRAEIFAFPSLDEGFGMPVLEAMAAATPVITSNCSALPEVAGDAALLVDPRDTSALADALRELAGNEDLRWELAVRGRSRAALFTWEKAARETWDVYQRFSSSTAILSARKKR